MILAIVAVGAVLWAGGWLWMKLIERERRGVYADATRGWGLARIFTGRNVERDLVALPGPPCPATVRFFHQMVDERHRLYTEFVASVREQPGAIRLSSQERRAQLSAYYGGRDLTLGDPYLDGRFLVQSNPPELVLDYLDERTRSALLKLDRHNGEPLLLQIRPGQLLVRVPTHIQEGRALSRFIDGCYALVTRLSAVAPSGMEVGAMEPVQGLCPVCGTVIDPAKRVLCRKCATPHHADCWAYNDGCSTFACGERKSRRA